MNDKQTCALTYHFPYGPYRLQHRRRALHRREQTPVALCAGSGGSGGSGQLAGAILQLDGWMDSWTDVDSNGNRAFDNFDPSLGFGIR